MYSVLTISKPCFLNVITVYRSVTALVLFFLFSFLVCDVLCTFHYNHAQSIFCTSMALRLSRNSYYWLASKSGDHKFVQWVMNECQGSMNVCGQKSMIVCCNFNDCVPTSSDCVLIKILSKINRILMSTQSLRSAHNHWSCKHTIIDFWQHTFIDPWHSFFTHCTNLWSPLLHLVL